jgi:hypothetical protein
MQGLAAANAKSATPFATAGRVEQVGTWWCGYCDHFFDCEGNVPLLTARRRVPVVAVRGNVSDLVCWRIGEHSSPTFGTEAVDGESRCTSLTPYIGMEKFGGRSPAPMRQVVLDPRIEQMVLPDAVDA